MLAPFFLQKLHFNLQALATSLEILSVIELLPSLDLIPDDQRAHNSCAATISPFGPL